MSRSPRNLIRIDLAPLSGVNQANKTYLGEHLCWWEADDHYEMIASIPCLRGVVAVHRPFSFLIDQLGEYAGT